MTRAPSYDHIACFIDDSDAASLALAHGAALRALSGGRLSVVHVIADPAFFVSMAATIGGAPPHDPALEREAAEMWLSEQVRDVEGAEAVLLEGQPETAACAWAREVGCDVMVAASHRGLFELSL